MTNPHLRFDLNPYQSSGRRISWNVITTHNESTIGHIHWNPKAKSYTFVGSPSHELTPDEKAELLSFAYQPASEHPTRKKQLALSIDP